MNGRCDHHEHETGRHENMTNKKRDHGNG